MQLAVGDITALVSCFSAPSLPAPLPRLFSPLCFAEFLHLFFFLLVLKSEVGTLYNLVVCIRRCYDFVTVNTGKYSLAYLFI